jgi:hypothetical protein
MELANPEIIAQLLAEQRPPRRSRLAATPIRASHPTAKRRCQCGSCAFCTENARWDRIFQEKFADPNYYKGAAIRFSSPLR